MLGLSNGLMSSSFLSFAGPGWLKVEFVSTQTGSGMTGSPAIGLNDKFTTTPPSAVGSPGDRVEIKYKIWIDNSTGKWDPEGDNDVVTTSISGMGYDEGFPDPHDIPTNEVVEIHRFLFTSENNSDPDLKLATWTVADDKPQAGAVFYIKDVYVRINRPGTGLGQPGDYSHDDLYIGIHTSDFTGDDLDACSGLLCYANLDLFNTNGTVNKTLNQSPDDI